MQKEKNLTWRESIIERNKRIKKLHKQRHTLRAIGLVVGMSGEGVRRVLEKMKGGG